MKQNTGRKLLGVLLALVLVLGLVQGMSLTAYAAETTVTWDYATFLSANSGFVKDQITFTSTFKNFANLYNGTHTFTVPAGMKFKKIEFATTNTDMSGATRYRFYSTQDQKNVNGYKVTWTGDSDSVTFSGKAFAVEYVQFTIESTIVAVDSVNLDQTTATLTVGGDAVKLTATVLPDTATDKKVKWSTNSSNVKLYTTAACTTEVGTDATETLTVYAKGVSKGSATVTVTSVADETKSAACTVAVSKADPTAPTDLTATYGQTLANVTLPTGWTWVDSTQSVGNVVDPAATFKANFAGNDNYNAASNVDVTVTVGKADPTAPTDLTATYGQTLANVTLPTGWTWVDSTQSVGNVVDPAATFKANFAGNDNYNAASNVDVTVTVSKADPTVPTGLTATYGQTLANVTLPDGWTWADSTQSVGNVVDPAATFKANFAGDDNHNAASDVDVTVTVGKADPTVPTGLTATYGQTLANVTLPDGWTWADSTQSVGNIVDPAATFKANFAGNDNYNAASNVDVTVTVGKADPTAPTDLTATYGQTLANVTLPTGWTWVDSTQSVGNVVDPAATFKANFAGNDNYNAASNVDVTVTVGKADPTAPTDLTATYGQTLANVTLPDGWTWADNTQSVGNIVDPAATFKANFAGNDNYNAASNVDVTVTVGKADPTAPTDLTATYGQTLANVTLPTGWTWVDSTQSVGNVVDPAATFKANFAGNDNYNAASNVDVTVTVGKADPTATAPTATATYGQTLDDVTLTNPTGNTAGTWAWVDAGTTSVGNVGEHTFKANFTPTDTANYNSVSDVDVTVTVGKANPTANAPTGLTATYGQTLDDVTLTNPTGNTAGTWAWVDAGTTSVGNVGEHTFKANFTPTDTANYNSVSDVDVTVTVGKANPTATAPTATATYGQTLDDVTLTNPTGNTAGTWAWVDAGTTSVGNVGEHNFKANFTPTDTANYNSVSDVDVTVTVGKANAVTATVTANSRTYDGTEKPLVTVAGEATGGEMQYALGTATEATQPYTTSIPSATNVDTYYVWYKAVAKDGNYVDSTPVCVEVKINAAQADGSYTVKPLPYDGNSQALVVPGEVIGGKMFYALGSDNVTAPVDGWSETVPTATEPGTYYVWYKVEGDENHNSTAPACIVVTIEKPYNPAEYSDFTLLATLKTSGKKALKLSWTAVEGAEGYDVFFGRSSASAAPYLTTVTGNEYTVNKLKNGRGYRANVQAWRTVNGNKVYIGQPSPDAFAITGGKTKKFTNPKKISVNKKKRNVTLAAGKTAKIKAKVTKVASGKRFLKQVAKIRYFSSDRRVATVDAKGNITAVGAGACKVFAVAANGLRVGVNVTVK